LPLLLIFHQQHERLLVKNTNNGFDYEKGINGIDPLPILVSSNQIALSRPENQHKV